MGIEIHVGDCREVLKTLPNESVDLVITDPPYNVGVDYGFGAGADRKEDYVGWLNHIWELAGRVCREGGLLIYTNRNNFIPLGMSPPKPWKFFHLAVWHKPLSLRPAFYGICPHWEPIFILLKGKKPWRPYRSDSVFNDVISVNVEYGRKNEHPTIKPLGLFAVIIDFWCPPGGTVLDPFAGSGTTLAAAKLLGRKAIGIEINPKYKPMIEKRIAETTFKDIEEDLKKYPNSYWKIRLLNEKTASLEEFL